MLEEEKMMSFFIQKRNMYLHQYLFLNFIYSTIISSIFFYVNNQYLNKISYNIIYLKTQPLNSYLLCTLMYIIIILVSATSFIGAPVISIGIIYRIICIISMLFKYRNSLLSFHNIFIIILPQIIIEFLITYILSFMSTYLSLQSFKLTFIQKDNFNVKYLFNYVLNYLVIIFLLIFTSALLKTYLV